MHMSDSLISPAIGAAMCVVSAASIAYSVAKIEKSDLSEKKIPIMAVAGAFVFAAQMINFTIPGTGSSGHIGGGILSAALLGGFPALLTISAVLIIQCLFFADGGLLALGCNIFNMGVIPCLLIYPLLFKPIIKKNITPGTMAAASLAAVVISLQLGAFGVVIETQASGISALPFSTFTLLMQPIHLAIGIIEGLVTAAVLYFVYRMRPEILESTNARISLENNVSIRNVMIALLTLTIAVGGALSMFVSAYPDGLEWAIEKTADTPELELSDKFLEDVAAIQETTAFMPDYDYKSSDEEGSSTGTTVAGLVGGAFVFILAGGTGFLISKAKKKKQTHN